MRVAPFHTHGVFLLAGIVGCGGGSSATDAGLDAPDTGADATDDAGDGDGGGSDAMTDGGPPPPLYTLLSETGFYSDVENKVVDPANLVFAPQFALWSDAAAKTRWIRLPVGSQIDTTTMDEWLFPVGTKLFKEFSVDGVVMETRLTEVTGPTQVWQGSFAWYAADGTTPLSDPELVFDVDREINVEGRAEAHVVPASNRCIECHRGTVSRVLGPQAIQLSHNQPGVTLKLLADEGRLSAPPAQEIVDAFGFQVPGNSTERAALGYLHANCGHCHANGALECFTKTGGMANNGLAMRLLSSDHGGTVGNTLTYLTAVDQMLRGEDWTPPGGLTLRVDSGDPGQSAVHHRMNSRIEIDQMPPVYTRMVDSDAMSGILTPWINSL